MSSGEKLRGVLPILQDSSSDAHVRIMTDDR